MSLRWAWVGVMWLALGCGISDLKVREADAAAGGKPAQPEKGGESGRAAADGGKGGAGSLAAGKGGSGGVAAADGGKGGVAAGGHGGDAPAAKGGSGGAGSGGSGGSGGAAGSGGDLMTAFTQYVEFDCGKFAQCGPFGFLSVFGDMATCRARRMLLFSWGVGLPHTGWTVDKVAACKAVVEAQSCRQYMDDDGQPECLPAGTGKNGDPCNTREQCASRFCATMGYGCGTCAAPPVEGTNCTADEDCPDRTVCGCPDDNCAQQICLRPRNEGEACSIGTPCGLGLNCLNDGICHVAPNQVNDACNANNMPCDVQTQGLWCVNNACVKLTPADNCMGTNYCQQRGSQCISSSSTCSPPPTDTGPCAPGGTCLYPALCVNGNCQLPGAVPACK